MPLRMDEATLKVGDDAVHGETAYAIGAEGSYSHPADSATPEKVAAASRHSVPRLE